MRRERFAVQHLRNDFNVDIQHLYTLATQASCISDPAEFFRLARPLIRELLAVDEVLVFFNDSHRECLVAPFLYNEMPDNSLEEVVISYQEPLIRDVLIGRRVHQRIQSRPPVLAGMQSESFLPILIPEEVLGCLYLGRRLSNMLSGNELLLAELLAYHLVVPLQRIHWEERSQRMHDVLNAFREQYLYILDTLPFPALVVDVSRDVVEEANLALLEWLSYSRAGLFALRLIQLCPSWPAVRDQGNLWPPQAVELNVVNGKGEVLSSKTFISPSSDSYRDRKVLIFIPDTPSVPPTAGAGADEAHLYTLSHDLKTPIQSLKGYATLLREEYGRLLPEGAYTYVQRMFANLEQMERLITNVIELSRVGRIDSRMEWANVTDILKDALDSLSGLMEHRSINLIIDSSLPTIWCEPTQMTRVFINLIANALKFTATVAMPSIEIGSNMDEHDYEFYVKDNGTGIAAEYQDKVFDLFFTRDGMEGDKSTGIGLTIVKRVIERHHGRVWVESQVGVGTVFKFTLPIVSPREELVLS
jgi:two-component sensor histidine kinase